MSTVFRRMLNTLGAYIAFAPLAYFAISLLTASIYKSMIAFSALFALGYYLLSLINNKKVKVPGKAVLITGCDSGFGNITAHRLAKKGMVVFAACLDAEKAKSALQLDGSYEVKTSTESGDRHQTGKIIPIQMDVTRDDQVQAARQLVEKTLKEGKLKLWAVVNNAGLGLACEAELTSMATCQRIMDVNFFGAVRVSNAFIPLLRYARGSRIVTISSILGLNGVPTSAAYSASKAAIRLWCEALRIELLKFDIQVCVICPDFYKTPMTSTENLIAGFDKELSRLPNEVRDAYGDEYFENQRKVLRNKDKITMSNPDTSPVVDMVCNCVLNYRPPYLNLPLSTSSRIFRAVMTSWATPQIILDWIMMTLTEQDNVPVTWSTKKPTVDEDGEETHGFNN